MITSAGSEVFLSIRGRGWVRVSSDSPSFSPSPKAREGAEEGSHGAPEAVIAGEMLRRML